MTAKKDTKFKKGNNYWQFRNKHGRDYKYQPEELWAEFIMYVEYMESNPLIEEKLFSFQGKIVKGKANKMRAMTIMSFQLFADICDTTWENYCKNVDFIAVTKDIQKAVYSQKFEGASADLLNANIIARDLGLKDKSDITSGDKPIDNKTEVVFTNFNGIKQKKKK